MNPGIPSLLKFIAFQAFAWSDLYVQQGLAKARAKGLVIAEVPRSPQGVYEALVQSAEAYPEGPLRYAILLARAAKMDQPQHPRLPPEEIRLAMQFFQTHHPKIPAHSPTQTTALIEPSPTLFS